MFLICLYKFRFFFNNESITITSYLSAIGSHNVLITLFIKIFFTLSNGKVEKVSIKIEILTKRTSKPIQECYISEKAYSIIKKEVDRYNNFKKILKVN